MVVHDHRLADHISTLKDVNLLELDLTIFLLEVGVSLTPLLLDLGVQGERAAQGHLLGRGDAVEDDAIVVLGDEGNIEAALRGHLHGHTLLNGIVAHAFVHAGLVARHEQLEAHRRSVRVDREHVEEHLALLVFLALRVEEAGHEGDLVASLAERHDLGLDSITRVLEADVLQLAVVSEADKLHMLIVKVEGGDLIGAGQTLDHKTAETDVRHEAGVVQVDLLCLDLGGAGLSLECDPFIISLNFVYECAIGVEVLIRGRLADSHDDGGSILVTILVCWQCPAVLCIALKRLSEGQGRKLSFLFDSDLYLLGSNITVGCRLADEDLLEVAHMRVHVVLEIGVTSPIGREDGASLAQVEGVDAMLFALHTLDDQTHHHAKVVRDDQKRVLLKLPRFFLSDLSICLVDGTDYTLGHGVHLSLELNLECEALFVDGLAPLRVESLDASDSDDLVFLLLLFLGSVGGILLAFFALCFRFLLSLDFLIVEPGLEDEHALVEPLNSRLPVTFALACLSLSLMLSFISVGINVLDFLDLAGELWAIIFVVAAFFVAALSRSPRAQLYIVLLVLNFFLLSGLLAHEEHTLAVLEAPDFLGLTEVDHVEVLSPAPVGLALTLDLNLSLHGVADVVLEETRALEGLDLFGIGAQVQELVRQVLQVDNHELGSAVKLADIVKALGVVAHSEDLVGLERRHAESCVLQTSVSLQLATSTPDGHAAVVVSRQARVVHAKLVKGSSSELDALTFLEHVASVLTVLLIA
mmetsp:Transcript_1797/g.2551  ORF Transcript_1797/g.2551 Transcript_1797/m.2551 type:complete len:754 (-) Transcript_1797:774-3035(-)